MPTKTVLALLLLSVQGALGARVLGVFVHPVRSSALFTHAVMSALADRGHQVTVYGPFAPTKPVPNMAFVEVHTEYHASRQRMSYDQFIKAYANKTIFFDPMSVISREKCDAFLKHPTVQDLVMSGEHFDLVITLGEFGEESLLSFGHIFNATTVVILPSGPWSTVNYLAGNALSIAHIPDYFIFDFSNRMTFSERALNLAVAVFRKVHFHLYEMPIQNELVQRHLPGLGVPPVEHMLSSVALTFVNAHPTLVYPQPYTPNIIPIRGIQLDSDEKPLPKDIQKLMDEAVSGVVYFSLGTGVPVESMPVEQIQTFINVFKMLPQIVIWKITLSSDVILPTNVHVFKWLSQKAILGHPNCKLFITHGGQASTLETLSAGIPVVGIPFFFDQPYNVRMYEEFGVGVGLNIYALTEKNIFSAVHKVLETQSYTDNARRVSRIFKDVPLTPAETVVYWVEYVIRHGGAPHLRPAATRLYWYQRALLDVIAVTVAIAIVTVAIIVYVLRRVYLTLLRRCWRKVAGKNYKAKTS